MLLLSICVLAPLPSTVLAQTPFDVAQSVAGPALGRHIQVLRDATGKLGIQDVIDPMRAGDFVRADSDAPSYGFTDAAYWLRLPVINKQPTGLCDWLLELGYPHLDWIELYVPLPGGGYALRKAGDRYPFGQRELRYRNFLFSLSDPPGQRTYYLRIQTSGAMSLPLRAWTNQAFLQNQMRELPILGMFYGVILVMAAYNLFIFFSARDRAYLYYVFYGLALGFAQFTFSGHAFEHLLPDQPALANRLPGLMVPLIFVWVMLFARRFLNVAHTLPRFLRALDLGLASAVGMAGYALLGPYSFRVQVIAALPFSLLAATPVYVLQWRKYRPAQFFAYAWGTLLVGALLYIFKTLGFLPTMLITEWGLQIGGALELVVLSLALADRINIMRTDLAQLNGQLSRNVVELQEALVRAEEGTRAKSEFLATMSHELRTPLNAIINVPAGLMSDFGSADAAACSACGALFELEPDDPPVSAETRCPACESAGSLRQQSVTRYSGSPEHTKYHLALIERSGRHLLHMVDGILDFSKLDAGALKLRLAWVKPAQLVQEALETVAEFATRSNVLLETATDPARESEQVRADPLRIKQVLINLLGNAIKFSSAGSKVTVTVARDGTDFLLSVRDRGIGIAAEHSHKIFERFEQVDHGDTRKYGGTGLGLSISRSLVEMHGGQIWFDSELGEGSIFYFRLPEAGPRGASGEDDPEPNPQLHATVATLVPAGARKVAS